MHAFDFLLDTYDTERLKTLSVWSVFTDTDMEFRPAARIRTPHEHMVHQCVSEDTWMKNMLGVDTGRPALPEKETRLDFLRHYADLSQKRLAALREKPEEWWRQTAKFFDVERPMSWIMLRRLTHSAHHRAQLVVYLRLLGRPIYSTYGPSADTGGLPVNKAPTIYRYESIDALLRAEGEGGDFRLLPGPGEKSPTERPSVSGFRSLERAPVRVREIGTTVSAWQMIIDSDRGSGTITLVDVSGQPVYRGEGIFVGWSQEKLRTEYQRLNKPPDEPFDLQQLG
ncbi:MAG TPA: DinB family protein [Thermoanaerobaculia bacterium]